MIPKNTVNLFCIIFILMFFFTQIISAQTDLSISVSSNSSTYSVAGYITFEVTVKNIGANAATGIHCNIPMPANVSGTPCNHATIGYWENYPVNGITSGDWKNFSYLAAGDCAVLRFKLYIDTVNSFTITANIGSTTMDIDLSNNSSSTTVNVGASSSDNTPNDCAYPTNTAACPNIVSLLLTSTSNKNEANTYVGNNTRDFPTVDYFTYTFYVSNSSVKSASNVTVQLNLPPGITYVSSATGIGTYTANTGIWAIPSVQGNTTTTLDITCYANAGGNITTTAQITGVDQPDNNKPYLPVSKTITGLLADLSISSLLDGSTTYPIKIGQVVNIVTTLTNNGPTRAEGVKVRALSPVGTSFISATTDFGQYWVSKGVWLLDSTSVNADQNHYGFTIQSGETKTLTMTVKTTPSGTFDIYREVRSSNMPDPNSIPSSCDQGLGCNFESENDFNKLTVTVSNIFLPIELSVFTAKKQKNNIQLNWQTLLEDKLSYFDIEKSLDGLTFQSIGKQKANNKPSEYIFYDNDNSGSIIYYRLKINETDNSSYYSKIISVEGDKKDFNVTALFPNPIDKILNIEWQSNDAAPVNFILMDVLGRIVSKQKAESREGFNDFKFGSDTFNSGIYFLSIEHNGTREIKQLFKK